MIEQIGSADREVKPCPLVEDDEPAIRIPSLRMIGHRELMTAGSSDSIANASATISASFSRGT